jgi:15-cis-phytoene desaturase
MMRKVGVELSDMLTWEDKIHVRVSEHEPIVFGLAPLFGMKKTIKGILGNQYYLSTKDKLSLIPFF